MSAVTPAMDEWLDTARDIPEADLPCNVSTVAYAIKAADAYRDAYRQLLDSIVATPPGDTVSFPSDELLFIAKMRVWRGRPGAPGSTLVGRIEKDPEPGHDLAVVIVWGGDR